MNTGLILCEHIKQEEVGTYGDFYYIPVNKESVPDKHHIVICPLCQAGIVASFLAEQIRKGLADGIRKAKA